MVHVEFNGLSGSGKTTLYRKANAFLESKLGYKPGPGYLWTSMLQDQSLQVEAHREIGFFKALCFRLFNLLRKSRRSRFVLARVQNWGLLRNSRPRASFSLGCIPPRRDGALRMMSEEEVSRAYNYERLTQFILTHREYTYRILEAYREEKYAEEWHEKDRYLVLEYFLILSTHYQSILSNPNRSWVMYDEGFYRVSVDSVIDDAGNLDDRGIKILQCMPHVDMVFHVEADIETCISRRKTRIEGNPKPYRKFEKEVYSYLETAKLRDDSLSKYLESIGKRVVRIDNNRSIDESFAEVAAHLNQLYSDRNVACPASWEEIHA